MNLIKIFSYFMKKIYNKIDLKNPIKKMSVPVFSILFPHCEDNNYLDFEY